MTDNTPKPTGLSPPDDPAEGFAAELARVASRLETKRAPQPKPARKPRINKRDQPIQDRKFTAVDTTTGETKTLDRLEFSTKDARSIMAVRQPKPPTPYSRQVADSILSLMAEGYMLREVCEMDGMPGQASVYRWMQEKPEFREAITHAREALGEYYACEVKRIADSVNILTFQQDRIRMDAFKWLAAKQYPRVYGDRNVTEHIGNVEIVQRHIIDATRLDDSQLEALEGVLTAANALPAPQDVDEPVD